VEVIRFLLDTNIFLELLLDQEKSAEVRKLLEIETTDKFFMTDFSLHSTGIILSRLGKPEVFNVFLEDMVIAGNLKIISLPPADMIRIKEISEKYQLDFDDAYQYLTAQEYELEIISFDTDFDKTDIKRKLPSQAV
jgi:predicted nucleic acid-binding protein